VFLYTQKLPRRVGRWGLVGLRSRADLRAEAETAILFLSPFALIALATGSTIEGSHPKACPEFVQSP
jgi:hypothetical protein